MGQKEAKLVCKYEEAAGSMTTAQLHSIRQQWMHATKAPNEKLAKEEFFEHIICRNARHKDFSSKFLDRLFSNLDTQRRGYLDRQGFFITMYIFGPASPTKKQQLLFNMFDSATAKPGDGKITKKGFRRVALELLSGSDKVPLAGIDGSCALEEKKFKSLGELMTEMVFDQFDPIGVGYLEFIPWLRYAREEQRVRDFFDFLVTIFTQTTAPEPELDKPYLSPYL